VKVGRLSRVALLCDLASYSIGSCSRGSCNFRGRLSFGCCLSCLSRNPPLDRQRRYLCKARCEPKTQSQPQRQQCFRNCVRSCNPCSMSASSLLTPSDIAAATHSTSSLTPSSPLGHHFANPFLFFSNSKPSPSASLIHPLRLKYLPNFSTPSLTQ
jgi:hypothetical protein